MLEPACCVGATALRTCGVADDFERFRDQYADAGAPVLDVIEQAVIGAVYGANGYTTRAQADLIGRKLELGPGRSLLDVGSGCGWPGLYLAESTGCTVVVTDVPMEGLRRAVGRLDADELAGRAAVVASTGQRPPFRDRAFDAVCSTDVLC